MEDRDPWFHAPPIQTLLLHGTKGSKQCLNLRRCRNVPSSMFPAFNSKLARNKNKQNKPSSTVAEAQVGSLSSAAPTFLRHSPISPCQDFSLLFRFHLIGFIQRAIGPPLNLGIELIEYPPLSIYSPTLHPFRTLPSSATSDPTFCLGSNEELLYLN